MTATWVTEARKMVRATALQWSGPPRERAA